MRVLLVQSPTGNMQVPIFPIGLAYLAGQITGHIVRGLDMSLFVDSGDVLRKQLAEFKPDVVAVSLRNIDDSAYPVTYSYLDPFHRMMEVFREWKGKLVVGGTGFSIYPQVLLEREPRIDFGIPGEAEVLFPKLLDHLEHGTTIEGWNGGRLLPTGRIDLNAISLPDYTFIDMKPYMKGESVGVQTRRGCAFQCTYCTYGFLSGTRFRLRPIGDVMEDLQALESAGIRMFSFVDSVFNAPEDYFLALLDALEKSGNTLQWSAWVDETISGEQLSRMKAAGAVAVDISPDAITDRGLRELGKRGRAADLLPVVKAARSKGLRVMVNFFNNNPGEGFIELLRKLWFMVRIRLTLGWRDTFVHIGTIRVYAHSPLARQMVDCGWVDEDCDFLEPVFYRSGGPADWIYRLLEFLRRIRHGRR